MHILLTNDDGISAEGLYVLYGALQKIGRVTVVAPDSQRSSVSHAITLAHPIWQSKVKRNGKFFGYGISGTPADCVKFGVSVVLKRKPDVIVSGINLGPNDGCSVFYSGTVAGAREGALMGIPSIAISLDTFVNPDFSYAAKCGAKFVRLIRKTRLPERTFLSINVPHLPEAKISGTRVTRQGLEPIHEQFVRRQDPNYREYYWMTGRMPRVRKNTDFDTHALKHGYVTVTPIRCDVTDHEFKQTLQALLN